MKALLSLTIGDTPISAPNEVPTGGFPTFETILRNSITILLIATVVFSLVMIIWAGITWITSNGDKAKVEAARKKIIYAVLGLIVALLSFTIITFVGSLLGIPDIINTQSYYPNCPIRGQDC